MPPFIGEHLWIGKLGHFGVVLALSCALFSLMAFVFAQRRNQPDGGAAWTRLGRHLFLAHVLSVLLVFSCIFYICYHHYYEYMYAYKHASRELETRYLLACIWEGQEGSFILWTIWHGVLGLILLYGTSPAFREVWLKPLMTVLGVAQFMLMLMVLGVYLFDIRIGNSPFTLTRDEIAAPIFSRPDYLTLLKDGMGLNVLLRNYWMVIHPPVLFLGFASTLIPFGFALSGLITRRHTEWTRPALPWALFSAAVLGVGIMMGGKWAYESLSFGGYWAWDPVENASLVPWLLLVAGIHTLLIYNATGYSLRSAYLFLLLTFIFVLYSTFLTRTGILGDTSVHAFTEAGKAINVMIGLLVLLFTLPPLTLFFLRRKEIPAPVREEETSSREFWMFVGALMLFLSALFIILITSIPVYGKTPLLSQLILRVHGGPLAMPEDPEFLYNKVMILVSVILGLITAFTQYLRYRQTEPKQWIRPLLGPTLAALLVSILLFFIYPFTYRTHGAGFLAAIYIAFFAAVYSVLANASYIFSVQKGKLSQAGGALSHTGFMLMIAGILISSAQKKVISDSRVNGIQVPSAIDPMTKKQDNPSENLTLLRQVPTPMGPYVVTYQKDSTGHEKGRTFYQLAFRDSSRTGAERSFTLQPDVYLMKDNNMSSNPDIRSYPTFDIFTYISFAMNRDALEDTAQFVVTELGEGEKAFYRDGYFVLNRVEKNPVNDRYRYAPEDLALMADLSFVRQDSTRFRAFPVIEADSLGIKHIDDTLYAANLFVTFAGVSDNRKVKIGVKTSEAPIDFVTVKTFLFPFISLVWLGLILMTAGIILSALNRARLPRMISGLLLVAGLAGLLYMFLIAG